MPVFELSIDLAKLKSSKDGAVTILKQVSTQAGTTQKNVESIGSKTNTANLEKSMTSLAAKLASLYAGFVSLQKVMGYVNNGFTVSSSIEDANISIASVLAATNKLEDAQGNLYTGQVKFQKALGISSELIQEIQVLALETSSTFESIVASVSGMVAPATAAGLAVADIPAFAVKATQAMNAMKIPVTQMRTELEAIFTGNINKSQDLLATNLGITGEMVREWKAAGTLVENLNLKLESFQYSGVAIADTWSGLRSNIQDAYDYISSQTGQGMFEGAKESYRQLLDLLINTEGKLGIGDDISNITKAIEELQDFIGNQLIGTTEDFIDYIKWLNEPSNIEELKKDFVDVYNSVVDVINIMGKVVTVIGDVGASAFSMWQQLPEAVQQVGLVGVVFGGAKGAVAITSILHLINAAQNSIKGLTEVISGNLSFNEFAESNFEDLQRYLDAASGDIGKQIEYLEYKNKQFLADIEDVKEQLAEKENEFISFSSNTEGLEKYLTDLQTSLANNNEKIAELKAQEAAILAQNSTPVSTSTVGGTSSFEGKITYDGTKNVTSTSSTDKTAAQIDKIKDSLAKLQKTDSEYREWAWNNSIEQMKASTPEAIALIEELDAAQRAAWQATDDQEAKDKQAEKNKENAQIQADFYKDFIAKGGQYEGIITLQNEAIQKQVEIWKNADIPDEYIEQMRELSELEISTDWLDGLERGFTKAGQSSKDLATTMENAVVDASSSMSSALADFATSGSTSFSDLARSILADLANIAIQSASNQVISQLFSSIGGAIFGGGSSTGAVSGVASSVTSPLSAMGYYAKGGVFGSINGYSNSIVNTPTFFSYDSVKPFASGGGVMGEAGSEAIMPLARTANGDLGVQAIGGQGSVGVNMPITVNVMNNTSSDAEATASSSNNAQGGFDIDVILKSKVTSIVTNDISAGNGGPIAKSMQSVYPSLKRKAW